jgi:hypothetical protein
MLLQWAGNNELQRHTHQRSCNRRRTPGRVVHLSRSDSWRRGFHLVRRRCARPAARTRLRPALGAFLNPEIRFGMDTHLRPGFRNGLPAIVKVPYGLSCGSCGIWRIVATLPGGDRRATDSVSSSLPFDDRTRRHRRGRARPRTIQHQQARGDGRQPDGRVPRTSVRRLRRLLDRAAGVVSRDRHGPHGNGGRAARRHLGRAATQGI